MPDSWEMAKCSSCRSIYLDPRPSPDSIGRAYSDYYTHDSVEESMGSGPVWKLVSGYLNDRFRMNFAPANKLGALLIRALWPLRLKLDVFGRHVPRRLCGTGARVLDVGCGNGAFLRRAQAMGLKTVGQELDPKAVAECLRGGLEVSSEPIGSSHWQGGTFEWITMSHVIEHVEDAPAMLLQLRELLAPGGGLWMGLPNPDALGFRWLGVGWMGLHPPYHVLIPSQNVLRKWLIEAGYVDVQFVRRGLQSPALWRVSRSIASREGLKLRAGVIPLVRVLGGILSSFGVRWAEETVVIAKRPKE